jgi:hypothetical protein
VGKGITGVSDEAARPATRLYGNWRRARGFGIGALGTGQTLTVFGVVLVPILAAYVSPRAALGLGLIGAVVVGLVVVRVGGSTAAEVIVRWVRFAHARSRGYADLSGGVLTEHPRKADLPGPMAPMVPLDTDDGRGGRQALILDRRTGMITAVFRVSPVGLDLADRSQADAWVASWGAWLADLGYQPLVRWIAVTVDTAPTGGSMVRDYVARRTDPHAPAAAREVMAQLVEVTPATGADVDTRVSITFDPHRAHPRPQGVLDAVAEVTRWLPGLESALGSAGVAVLGRASIEWLTSRLRIAYDPAARPDVLLGSDQQLASWQDAAPIRASEQWDYWQHDSGISVSWALAEAPRQAVTDRVLTPLLAPGVYPRRVTLLREPLAAEAAGAQVEAEIANNSMRRAWAARSKRDETQRDRDDQARAMQAAQEEAQGAGVCRFSMYVTTTVLAQTDLPAATADVEQRAGQAKIRLRRLRGAHSAGFAASLGLGVNPVELARRTQHR